MRRAEDGYELRLSKNGKIYVQGRDGLPPELAEIFGRYPTAGQNDGIGRAIADATGNEAFANMKPSELAEALAADRAAYADWVKAREQGLSPEQLRDEQHWADEQARDEAEHRERFENSGMSAIDYVKSRIEEGEPDFDLDWETMREIDRDIALGNFSRPPAPSEPANSRAAEASPSAKFAIKKKENDDWRTVIDNFTAGNLKARADSVLLPRVPVVIARVLNEKFNLDPNGKNIVISNDVIKKALYGKHRILPENFKRLVTCIDAPLAVFKSRSRPNDSITALLPIRDENGGISSVVAINYLATNRNGSDALRINSVYGKVSRSSVQNWIDNGLLLYADRKNISRSFPHGLQLPGRTKTAKRFLDVNDFTQEQLGIIPNLENPVNSTPSISASPADSVASRSKHAFTECLVSVKIECD